VRCRLGAGTTARFSAGIVKAGQRPALPGLLRLWGSLSEDCGAVSVEHACVRRGAVPV